MRKYMAVFFISAICLVTTIAQGRVVHILDIYKMSWIIQINSIKKKVFHHNIQFTKIVIKNNSDLNRNRDKYY